MVRGLIFAREMCNQYKEMSGEELRKNKLHLLLFMGTWYCISKYGEPIYSCSFKISKTNTVICEELDARPYELIFTEFNGTLSSDEVMIARDIVIRFGKLTTWALKDLVINTKVYQTAIANGDTKILQQYFGYKGDIKDSKEKAWIIDRPHNTNWVLGEHKAGYKFSAKVFDEGSQYGINKGRVSVLSIRRTSDNTEVMNYDRGWDIKPINNEVKEVCEDILKVLNSCPKICS